MDEIVKLEDSNYEIKNFVFDFGNVLFKWDIDDIINHYVESEKDKLEIKEVIFQSKEWTMLDNGTITYDEAERIFKNKLSEHLEIKVNELLKTWYEQMPLNKPICDFIKKLKINNYKVYALSNTHVSVYEYIKRLDIGSYFDGFIISAVEKMIKPNYDIYNILIEKFNLKPNECLFIDDTKENVLGAEKCGLHGFVYDITNTKIEEIEAFISK